MNTNKSRHQTAAMSSSEPTPATHTDQNVELLELYKPNKPSKPSRPRFSGSILPRMPKKAKRYSIIAAVVIFVVLLVFAEIIRPNQDAKSYTARLNASSKPLEDCFRELADTTELDIYYAPDIAINEKQRDVKTIAGQINTCQNELNVFDAQAHKLLNLHFAGYTQVYHEAQVNQRQAYDVVGQSNDVLQQYSELAVFLEQYYAHVDVFLAYFKDVQKIEASYSQPSTASIKVISQQAADLRKRAAIIRQLKASPGFEMTKLSTAEMFENMATGFENTAKGYANYNDNFKNLGFKQVDEAVAVYDSKIINLPFEQLKVSYVPKQVQQLPVKVETLLATQTE